MEKQIKNLLFDMGNVMFRFDPEAILLRKGVTVPEDRALLKREVYGSVEWVRVDRGAMTEEEALRGMLRRLPERLHGVAKSLVLEWNVRFDAIAGMEELLSELEEAGYGLYLLTNASLFHVNSFMGHTEGRHFRGKVMLSAEWHVMKPAPAFYEKALELFDLNREECLFIDDSPVNCEGAMETGIDSILFRGSPERLREELRERGVRISL